MKQNDQKPFGIVTCSTNGYIVSVEMEAAGRLFPVPEDPLTDSLRKALITPAVLKTCITHDREPLV